MGYEGHVVCVDGSEGGKAVAHYGEEGNEDAVDDVDDVFFSVAEGYPAD